MLETCRILLVMARSAKDLFANVKQISLVEGVNDDGMNAIQILAKIGGNAYLELRIQVSIIHTFSIKRELEPH